MDAEEFSVPYGRASDQIPCWLHPADSKTLVLIIHGHNHHGDSRMLRALAEKLQSRGVAAVRFTVLREDTPKGVLVNTLTEELQQAKAVLEQVRVDYNNIIVCGHSQAGIIATQLALDGEADAIALLMPLIDTAASIERRLSSFQMTIDELRTKKYHTYQLQDGTEMLYTPAFFEDLELWDVPGMLTQCYVPSLFVAGSKDTRISADEVEHGFSMANDPKELFTVDDEHLFSVQTAHVIGDKLFAFLEEQGLVEDGDLY